MVKVCGHCSNVDVEALKSVVDEAKLYVGCIEHCAAHADKSYGFINGQMVVVEDSEAFVKAVQEAL